MSETTTETVEPTEPAGADESAELTSDELKAAEAENPDYFARLRQESAKYRTAAKANAEAASKVEGLTVKAQEAEEARKKAEAALARSEASRKHRLSDDQHEFLSELTDVEAIESRAAKLAAMNAAANRPVDPAQGSTSDKPASSGEQFAEFFTQQMGA